MALPFCPEFTLLLFDMAARPIGFCVVEGVFQLVCCGMADGGFIETPVLPLDDVPGGGASEKDELPLPNDGRCACLIPWFRDMPAMLPVKDELDE